MYLIQREESRESTDAHHFNLDLEEWTECEVVGQRVGGQGTAENQGWRSLRNGGYESWGRAQGANRERGEGPQIKFELGHTSRSW